MKYLIVFYALLSFSLMAQDLPSFENEAGAEQQETRSPTDVPVAVAPEEIVLPDIEASNSSSNSESNGDFEVFQPSEDISEDLSVPFPSDI